MFHTKKEITKREGMIVVIKITKGVTEVYVLRLFTVS